MYNIILQDNIVKFSKLSYVRTQRKQIPLPVWRFLFKIITENIRKMWEFFSFFKFNNKDSRMTSEKLFWCFHFWL